MSRRIRFIPEGGALVEVTCRALQSRLLFRPSPLMNQIIIGTLTRAKQRHKVQVCFFVGVSNHMHLLLWVEDARGLAKFMGYFLSKLAREVGRLTGWKEKIFGRRYQAIVFRAGLFRCTRSATPLRAASLGAKRASSRQRSY